MNTSQEQAARHGVKFAASIAYALASGCPQRAADADRALASFGSFNEAQRRLAGTPAERAAAVVECLWFGASNRAAFARLFGLQFDAVWSEWGCAAATAGVLA